MQEVQQGINANPEKKVKELCNQQFRVSKAKQKLHKFPRATNLDKTRANALKHIDMDIGAYAPAHPNFVE